MGMALPTQRSVAEAIRAVPAGLVAHRDLLWPAGAVLLAFALRLTWALYSPAHPNDGRMDDSFFYHSVGAALADGGPYTSPFTQLPTAQWPPGYPFFLAGLYWLFGPSVTAAQVANAVLGAGSVALVYLLALRLFDRATALIAALLLAAVPGQVLFASLLYSETLFTFLFLLGLLLLTKVDSASGRTLPRLVAFGVVTGAAALVREAGLALLVIGFAYWGLSDGRWQTSLRWSVIAVAAAGALIAPWTVRNALALDGFVLLSSSAGANFWMGHHEGASGEWDFADINVLLEDTGPISRPGGEVAVNNAGYRKGLRYALTHPLDEAWLTLKKLRILYRSDSVGLDINDLSGNQPFMASGARSTLVALSNVAYFGVIALAALGVGRWALERTRGPLLPVIAIAVLTVGQLAFFVTPRYHFAMVPLFCLLAAWALAGLPRWVSGAGNSPPQGDQMVAPTIPSDRGASGP